MKPVDLCIIDSSGEVVSKAKEIGWKDPDSYDSTLIEADNWGELKQKIKDKREESHVLIFSGGNEKLNRKAVTDSRVDVLLHPEKNRKDSGFDEPMARKAAENNVALGLDFRTLSTSDKNRVHALGAWRKNLRLCEKHDTPYIITTGAEEKFELRAPKDLETFLNSIGFSGKKALQNQKEILRNNSTKLQEE